MRRLISQSCLYQLTDYEPCHHPVHQEEFVDDFPINPRLRSDFDRTPHHLREELEITDWWQRPYILRITYEAFFASRPIWAEHLARMARARFSVSRSKDEFDRDRANEKTQFMKDFPDGMQFTVRCLDGGAQDRSSWIGQFSTLNAAIKAAKDRIKKLPIMNRPA